MWLCWSAMSINWAPSRISFSSQSLIYIFLFLTHIQTKCEVSSLHIWSSNNSSPNFSKIQTQMYNFFWTSPPKSSICIQNDHTETIFIIFPKLKRKFWFFLSIGPQTFSHQTSIPKFPFYFFSLLTLPIHIHADVLTILFLLTLAIQEVFWISHLN